VKLPNRIAAVAVALASLVGAASADTTVVIVRHGEKPPQGLGQLTCQGLNRALALAPVLLSRYGKPAAIYAPNPAQLKKDHGVAYAYVRPLATVEPLAVRAGLPVNLQWGMTDVPDLAEQMLAAAPGTYVVGWEHHWGENLARYLLSRLGGNPLEVPAWQDDDFDSIYVVRIEDGEKGSRHASFTREQEDLDGLPQECAGQPR
jgi:broad specificity phosphatase PhoE